MTINLELTDNDNLILSQCRVYSHIGYQVSDFTKKDAVFQLYIDSHLTTLCCAPPTQPPPICQP